MSTSIKPGQQADEFMTAIAATLTDRMLKEAEPVIEQALKDMEAKMRARARECALAVLDHSMEIHSCREVLTIRIQQPKGGWQS